MQIYTDPQTGYEVRQYTKGAGVSAKLYFSGENFTPDDGAFFFHRFADDRSAGTWCADANTGEQNHLFDNSFGGFCPDRNRPYAVTARENRVFRIDFSDWKLTEVGAFPEGSVTGHLTVSKSGLIFATYQLKNKIFAVVSLDPATGKSVIHHKSDYHLGHGQICPGDDNTMFYIHETGGDALQRTWLLDTLTGETAPYYVERDNEWITHETWSADGENIVMIDCQSDLCRLILGDKHGHVFHTVARGEKYHHPGISRDKRWFCVDRQSGANVTLISREGQETVLALAPADPRNGNEHMHPSFNRKGDCILFTCPQPDGSTQVCAVDLRQVECWS